MHLRQDCSLRLGSGGITTMFDLLERALQSRPKPFAIERLKQVIDCMHLEGTQSELIVRRNEDDDWHWLGADRLEDLESIQFGHLDIKKNELRRLLLNRVNRLASVGTLADQLNLGVIGKQLPQPLARQRFI